MSTIFNVDKSDYGLNESVFLGQDAGLFDTINKRHPKIWKLYKSMKQLDWDELEFDFTSCNAEFKMLPKSITERMIKTLAWQWEADSVAARTVYPIMAPFISAPELQAAWSAVATNELLHAACYSEIVRTSFDDPNQVLKEVLEVKEAMQRLKTVIHAMEMVYKCSHEYALGIRGRDQDTYNHAYLFTVVLLILERIQFMASFAVTFSIGAAGDFMPIAKSVQKIAQDEYEVHVQIGKEVLLSEARTKMGQQARKDLNDIIVKLIHEVVESEVTWAHYLLGPQSGQPLVGLTFNGLRDWVYYSALDVCMTLQVKPQFPIPNDNPLPFISDWMNIGKQQPSPQEQQNGQYRVGVMTKNDQEIYDVDF